MNGLDWPIPGERSMLIAVCQYMGGWSQADYDNADAGLIDEIEHRIAAQSHWSGEKAKQG